MDNKPESIFIGYFSLECCHSCEVVNICATFDEKLAIKIVFDFIDNDQYYVNDLFRSPLTEDEIQNVHNINDFNRLITSKKYYEGQSWDLNIVCVKINY
jgi:hypothetical protein